MENSHTTFYSNSLGGLSSIKTSILGGGTFTSYLGSSRGGMTTKIGDFISRINNSGQTLSLGFRGSGRTSYWSPSFGQSSKIKGY